MACLNGYNRMTTSRISIRRIWDEYKTIQSDAGVASAPLCIREQYMQGSYSWSQAGQIWIEWNKMIIPEEEEYARVCRCQCQCQILDKDVIIVNTVVCRCPILKTHMTANRIECKTNWRRKKRRKERRKEERNEKGGTRFRLVRLAWFTRTHESQRDGRRGVYHLASCDRVELKNRSFFGG